MSRIIPPIEQGLEKVEDIDEERTFDELRNAAPLRCASAATTPSTVSSLEGHGVKSEVEVGLKQQPILGKLIHTSLDKISKTPTSLDNDLSLLTSSMPLGGKQASKSLLATGPELLVDGLVLHEKVEEGLPTGEGNQGNEGKRKYPGSGGTGSRNRDDGYSADRSASYTLENANCIDEDSMSASSFVSGMGLRRALPMMNAESGEENSLCHGYNRYGHIYSQDTLSQPPLGKPVIPTTFPSLMDSSVSSTGFSVSSTALSSVMGGSGSMKRGGHTMEKEEREDSLPPISTSPQIMYPCDSMAVNHMQRRDAAIDALSLPQGSVRVEDDPLMTSASPSTRTMSSSAAVVAKSSKDNTQDAIDSRINIDHERHYIVDLERINEESSINESRTASSPRNISLGSTRASSPRAAALASNSMNNSDFASVSSTSPGITTNFKVHDAAISEASYISGQQPFPRHFMLNPPGQSDTQFYNYRHQYYMEQYHYCDERFSLASNNKCEGGDSSHHDSDSNCSSVTLSQAFQEHLSDENDSCSSSITDECYLESHSSPSSPSQISTVSSVTLSRALSVDKHEHSCQGFYVATRLGDFFSPPELEVEVPNKSSKKEEGAENDMKDEPSFLKTVYKENKEEFSVEVEMNVYADNTATGISNSDIKSGGDATTSSEDSSNKSNTCEHIDAVSNSPAEGSTEAKKNSTIKITSTAEDIGSEIISSFVPDCGVPSPSIMAKVGSNNVRRIGRAPRGGMLLPWHSTRSIQNYHGPRGGGGKKKKRGSRQSSLYSIGSVHSFRG